MANMIIDGRNIEAGGGKTILQAALEAGVYIPHLCFHPQLTSLSEIKAGEEICQGAVVHRGKGGEEFEGCKLCLVEIEGRDGLFRSCKTVVEDGMSVRTDSLEVKEAREKNLAHLLERHPHACLLCAQAKGCDRKVCSPQVPEEERCCSLFGNCELQRLATSIGMKKGLPPYIPHKVPVIDDEPLIQRDYNLCVGCLRCVRVCKEVKGVDALGFIIEEGRVVVGSKGRALKESGCQFCGYCIEVCPTGALTDKDAGVGKRETYLVPCRSNCPAGIDVPRYVRMIVEGKYAEAVEVIREKVPFPRVLGYICPRHCEVKCRRGEINEPIDIKALKRFAMEHDNGQWKNRLKPGVHTGKKVAIVGSGPAGLSAAYYLTRMGHSAIVFEGASRPGGMMRMGIPRFLLPEEVLDEEIKEILSYGIELKLNSTVEDISQFLKDGYDAVLIAIGLQEGRKIPIPGSDLEGVLIGLDFLRDITEGKKVKLGQNVLVLGGGGVACDVARTALRLGVPKIAMACLESRETLPAPLHDIKRVEEEGVEIFPSRSFKQILGEDGRVKGIECLQVRSMKFDEEGKLHLETFPGSEHTLEADTIIFATGQALNQQFTKKTGLEVTPKGVVKAHFETLEAGLKGVFISGDAVTGPASVVEAVATGRKAAESIDKYLNGQGVLEEGLLKEKEVLTCLGREEHFAGKERIEPPLLPVEERLRSFENVELPLSSEQAIAEASRCLKCDLRFKITPPIMPPELLFVLTEENLQGLPEGEGVYVLYDEKKEVYKIVGVEKIRQALVEEYGNRSKARYFYYEEDPMFTSKERQLVQQYMKKHGSMPPGNDELEDLF